MDYHNRCAIITPIFRNVQDALEYYQIGRDSIGAAAMARILSEDTGLPSDSIRQVKEIPGGCVVYEIPGASFLSISLSLFVNVRPRSVDSTVCGNLCNVDGWSALQRIRALQTFVPIHGYSVTTKWPYRERSEPWNQGSHAEPIAPYTSTVNSSPAETTEGVGYSVEAGMLKHWPSVGI